MTSKEDKIKKLTAMVRTLHPDFFVVESGRGHFAVALPSFGRWTNVCDFYTLNELEIYIAGATQGFAFPSGTAKMYQCGTNIVSVKFDGNGRYRIESYQADKRKRDNDYASLAEAVNVVRELHPDAQELR